MTTRRTTVLLLTRGAAAAAGIALLAGCTAGPASAATTGSTLDSTPSSPAPARTAGTAGGTGDRGDTATERSDARSVRQLFTRAFADPSSSTAVRTAARVVAPDAVTHGGGSGPAGLLAEFRADHRRIAGAHAMVKHLASDGDLVAVHWQLTADVHDERQGEAAVDLFRMAHGRVVEHWSLAQTVATGKPASGNTNTMFSDLYRAPASQRHPSERQEERNRRFAVSAYDTLFRDHDVSVLDRDFDPAYLQHNPVAPNGTAALKKLFGGGTSFPAQESVVSLADGDLVWTFSRQVGASADSPFLAADLFRVDGGLIREHWDVVPPAAG
jgi:predicted SnoaL-like aldol condensation-catalyzing enzyme